MSEQNVVFSHKLFQSKLYVTRLYDLEDTIPPRAIEFADIISPVYREQIIRLQH